MTNRQVGLSAAPRRLSMGEAAYQHIKEGIVRGLLMPGERLVEDDLSRQLGVSRSRVREALAKLQREGLITVEPFRGTWVSRLELRDVDEIYTARILIEPWAARTVASRHEHLVMARLSSDIERMIRALELGDVYQLTDADHDFHVDMVRGTGNRRLAGIAEQMLDFVWRTTPVAYEDRDAAARIVDEHVATLNDVLSGDADLAETSVRRHLEIGRDLTLQIVRRHSEDGTAAETVSRFAPGNPLTR